ncbi:HD domain-containing phosphohydrolase [Sedimenticola sp.]|uniref:HD domain-containing phosphohydrolase n=1 Tax=Sedimenticola sp. TaxID=1940285 RepID=UPI003D0C900C
MTETRPKILIVDDETFYIDVLMNLLQDDYHITVAKDGKTALKRISENSQPDLVLLDILMPGMDGYEVCKQIKKLTQPHYVPVIFLTVKGEVEDEIKGFELGAADYISKPFSPPIVKARVRSQINLANHQHLLERVISERTEEIARTRDVAIYCMASLAETRDNETGKHIQRTQSYVKALASQLKAHPKFKNYLDEERIELLYRAAPLHDIGKVGVPDRVLLKPGKLDEAEWHEMKRHTEYGLNAIENAEKELGNTPLLDVAKTIAYTHHERWDGTGYPSALKGDDIPISGRLMALADVYDALISKRVYKEAFSHEKAVEIISQSSGTHFDPDVVEAFMVQEQTFKSIAERLKDRENGSD